MKSLIRLIAALSLSLTIFASELPTPEECERTEATLDKLLQNETAEYKAKKCSPEVYANAIEALLKDAATDGERYVIYARLLEVYAESQNYAAALSTIQKLSVLFEHYDTTAAVCSLYEDAFKKVKGKDVDELCLSFAATYAACADENNIGACIDSTKFLSRMRESWLRINLLLSINRPISPYRSQSSYSNGFPKLKQRIRLIPRILKTA